LWGTPAERDMLAARRSRLRIRWDRAASVYCHHQKSWLIDAGQESETAFVGGLNLTPKSYDRHDVYTEVTGPSATDVHHNFVERWNGASERRMPDGNWGCDASDALPLPGAPSAVRGPSPVQIQRMFGSDRSILEQYQLAIDSAQRSIYIENQAIPIPAIAERLGRALARGVEVTLLVPSVPEEYVYEARKDPARRALFEGVEALARYPGFRLAGISIYVHAKLMIVDDEWATIGSCNLHAFSLGGHSEMNASIWDAAVARDLRDRLRRAHEGRMFALSPALYGVSR